MHAQTGSPAHLGGAWRTAIQVTWVVLVLLSLVLLVVSVPAKLHDLTQGYVGIDVERNDAGEVVISAVSDVHIAQMGIREGDVIVAVDNVPIQSEVSLIQVRGLFQGPIGAQITASVRGHDNVIRRHDLTRAYSQLGLSLDHGFLIKPYWAN